MYLTTLHDGGHRHQPCLSRRITICPPENQVTRLCTLRFCCLKGEILLTLAAISLYSLDERES